MSKDSSDLRLLQIEFNSRCPIALDTAIFADSVHIRPSRVTYYMSVNKPYFDTTAKLVASKFNSIKNKLKNQLQHSQSMSSKNIDTVYNFAFPGMDLGMQFYIRADSKRH